MRKYLLPAALVLFAIAGVAWAQSFNSPPLFFPPGDTSHPMIGSGVDHTTGFYSSQAGEFDFTSKGTQSWGLNALGARTTGSSGLIAHSGGGQSGALAIVSQVNQVSTVASSNDSVLLPASAIGLWVAITNSTTPNAMAVYGAGSDTINNLSTLFSCPAQKTCIFFSSTVGKWFGGYLN